MSYAMAAGRIVVGVDGTAASAAAVQWAAAEARLRHATVCLIRAVHEDPRMRAPYAPRVGTPGRQELEASAQAELDEATALALRRLPRARIKAEIADDLPARALLSRADGAEMLVLGTTRSAQLENPVIGPVARTCLREARCTVVIVTPGDHGPRAAA